MKGNEVNCYKQSKKFCLPVAPGASWKRICSLAWRLVSIPTATKCHLLPCALINRWCFPLFQAVFWNIAITHSGQCHRSYSEDLGRGRLHQEQAVAGETVASTELRHLKDGCLVPQPSASCLPPAHIEPWDLRKRSLNLQVPWGVLAAPITKRNFLNI